MPRFEAGNHVGKAAMNTEISGQLLQAAPGSEPVRNPSFKRGRSRHGGRFHVQRNCTADVADGNANPNPKGRLSN
jgi:hypothetical protein